MPTLTTRRSRFVLVVAVVAFGIAAFCVTYSATGHSLRDLVGYPCEPSAR